MGNYCEGDDICKDNKEGRSEIRKRLVSSSSKITQKDLIKIKKYPIENDYTIINPPIGKGSFGSVYKIIHKESGITWAGKKIEISKGTVKYFQ